MNYAFNIAVATWNSKLKKNLASLFNGFDWIGCVNKIREYMHWAIVCRGSHFAFVACQGRAGQCRMVVVLQQTKTYQPKAHLCSTVSNTLVFGHSCVPTEVCVRSYQPLWSVRSGCSTDDWLPALCKGQYTTTYLHTLYIAWKGLVLHSFYCQRERERERECGGRVQIFFSIRVIYILT